jgi:carboxyl-terminal processing protease
MDDGSAIILSVAKYYSPDGKSIQDNGVTPEELVADAAEASGTDVDDDAEPAPAAPPVATDKKPSEDLILQKAIDIARKKV